MPAYRKRRWPWIVCGYAVLLAILGAVTGIVHDAADAADKPLVLRGAVAVLVAIVLIHIRRHFRGDPLWDPPSEFADALARAPAAAKLPPDFVKRRGEVANGIANRAYFERVLWPHLAGLARARVGAGFEPLLPPPGRRGRRGPSVRALSVLVHRIEGQE